MYNYSCIHNLIFWRASDHSRVIIVTLSLLVLAIFGKKTQTKTNQKKTLKNPTNYPYFSNIPVNGHRIVNMPSQIFTLSLRLAGLTKDPFVAFIIVIVTLLPLISSAFCRTFDVFQLEILLNELEKEPEEKYKNFLLKILFLISLSFCSNSGRKILIVNPNGRQTLARSSETRINSF